MADPLAPNAPSRILTEYYSSFFFAMALLFLGASLLILKPMLDSVKTTNAHIASQLRRLDGDRAYLKSLEQSIDAAQTIAPTVLGQVDQALPREQQIPELVVLFSQTAARDGVKIPNLSFAEMGTGPGARAATTTISELSITMTATAQNYGQIKKFIRDLEVSLRLLDISGINVSISNQGKETAYALQMKTYMFSPARRSSSPSLVR